MTTMSSSRVAGVSSIPELAGESEYLISTCRSVSSCCCTTAIASHICTKRPRTRTFAHVKGPHIHAMRPSVKHTSFHTSHLSSSRTKEARHTHTHIPEDRARKDQHRGQDAAQTSTSHDTTDILPLPHTHKLLSPSHYHSLLTLSIARTLLVYYTNDMKLHTHTHLCVYKSVSSRNTRNTTNFLRRIARGDLIARWKDVLLDFESLL